MSDYLVCNGQKIQKVQGKYYEGYQSSRKIGEIINHQIFSWHIVAITHAWPPSYNYHNVQVLYKDVFPNSGPPFSKQNKHGLWRPPPKMFI